jgi:hypothetical protein
MTLDQLGAKMRCDKCGKRPERYYAAKQSERRGSFEACRTVEMQTCIEKTREI